MVGRPVSSRSHSSRRQLGGNLVKSLMVMLAALGVVALGVQAQQSALYPTKPIRMLVPFAPGGPTDVIARVIAAPLGERLGQSIIVENRPGAGGNIAIVAVAKSAPDGYTLLFSSSNIVSNPWLYEKPPFDTLREFAPITYAAVAPNIIYVHPTVPAKNIAELVALMKSQPGKFSYGSPGAGTTPHVACEALRLAAGIDFQHVPYNGAAPVITAVLGGQVPIGCTAMPPTVAQIKAGAIRAIAVTSAKRSGVLPEVPTLAESGFPDVIADNMQGVLAPAGTPREIVHRLQSEIAKVLADPEIRKRLQAMAFDLHASTPEEFTRIITEESARYAKVIKAAGLRAE
ncbi:MAG: tripartite tricarboxylate transporter substrate binding protein, partial [Burkholderiales bacterium]